MRLALLTFVRLLLKLSVWQARLYIKLSKLGVLL